MNSPRRPSGAPGGLAPVGTKVGPVAYTVSAAANERYWSAAGADHPTLRAGALYPPIAANLTILALQTVVDRPMIQTAQRLVCHRMAGAGTELTVAGTVTERYEKRGREHTVVEAIVALPDGDPLWTSTVTFTEPEPRGAP